MFKFIQISSTDLKGGLSTHWRLLIDNSESLLQYLKLDTTLNVTSYFQNTNSHKNGRALVMETILEMRSLGLSDDITESPLVTISNFLDKKAQSMLKAIQNGNVLCINEVGGYTFYTESLLTDWDASIVNTIEKDDLGFPIDGEVINSNFLILENDVKNIGGNIKKYLSANNIIEFKTIFNLLEIDKNYIVQSINNAKTIAFESQLVNQEQIDTFLKVFAYLNESKIIIISIPESKLIELKDNHLFKRCFALHKIIII